MVTHSCNPSTQWVEGPEILSLDYIVSLGLACFTLDPVSNNSNQQPAHWHGYQLASLSDAFERDLWSRRLAKLGPWGFFESVGKLGFSP